MDTQNCPTTRITITFPTNAYFMSGLRDFTLTMIKNMTQFSDQWAYRFQSVVDELCNNAIEHGSSSGQEVRVTFNTIADKYIEIIVEDSGTGKSKLKAAELTKLIEERRQPGYPLTALRGRGLPKIVAEWTDELEFTDRPEGGLMVRIRKILRKEDAKQIISAPLDPTHLVLTA